MSDRPDQHFVEGYAPSEIGCLAIWIIARGHPVDIAAQMCVERDIDWRKPDSKRCPRFVGEGAR
ncbi:hypothetical protein ACO34A_03585 [Rhizobium sp. ACO-34A]|nr:hypothetical protein [Rhizobium sp. ACO-34A]ATN32882.1 hypothetical protein ACO34A_03585 [Rhizobium sp. ACO-34A]